MKRLQLRRYKLFIITVSAAVVTFSLKLLHTVSFQESGSSNKILEPALHLFQAEKSAGAKDLMNGLRPKSEGSTEGPSRFSDYRWQPVGDSLDTYVYSAYLDDLQSPPILRVIAIIVDHLNDHNLTCLYYDKFPSGDSDQPYMVRRVQRLQYIPEPDWKYKYRGAFLHCPVSLDAAPPQAVSIAVTDSPRAPVNLLPVRWARRGNPLRYDITRCIPALHSNFSQVTSLLEMFAFSQKFGVNHFIMYVLNVSESVSHVLDLYRKRGLLEVYEWNLPVNTTDIHYYGQLSNMQDCLYRSLHISRYVLIGDVDELFVPHQGRQLLPMLWRHLHSSLVCGALQFINVFFPLQLPDTQLDFPGRDLAERYNLSTLLKTTAMTDPTVDRQKMVLDPTRVETTYIHDASKFRPGFMKCMVNISDIALHHYRTLTHPGDLQKLANGFGIHLDFSLHQFAPDVIQHIQSDLQALDSL